MTQLPNSEERLTSLRTTVWSLLLKFNLPILLTLFIGIIFFASLSFDIGFSGVIVETHPAFWALIATALYYAFKIRKKKCFVSVLLIYMVGLGLRLLVAFHTMYPGSGPWNELGSVNFIRSSGLDLKAKYYHSGMPVLQSLILLMGPTAGDYLTIAFVIPILAWTLSYIMLFFFCRPHLPPENTLVALLLFTTANVFFQSTTRAEIIALPLGMLIIYILLRKRLHVSNTDLLLAVGLYTLLTFTHHLTAGVVMLILAALTLAEKTFRRYISRNLVIVFLASVLIFFSYWEIYQGLLSDKLAEIALSKSILPVPWPKPIWWWILYLLPKLFTAGLIIYFTIHILRLNVRSPIKDRLMSICFVGALVNMFAPLMPGGYLFLRIFHQFYGYHTVGISNLPRSEVLLKVLAVSFLVGLIADFPMINRSNNYVIGGHWFDHSHYEVEGAEFLATQIPNGSRIAIDARVAPLIYIFVPPGKVIAKEEPLVYSFISPEEAWNYSISRNYHYIYVSKFYKTMFIFKGGSGATKFSEEQLNKFLYPFFVEVFRNEEVIVYKVNRGFEKMVL